MAADVGSGGGQRGNRLRWWIWGTAAALLALPAVAMRFTAEVNWTASDFVIMGALLFGACAAYEVAAWRSRDRAYRAAAGIAIVTGFLVVWSNLAVGIIASEDNRYNMVFFGILALACIGGAIGLFRARAMSRTFCVVAVAQALAAAYGATQDVRGAVVSTFFVGMWLLAAGLFGVAARRG